MSNMKEKLIFEKSTLNFQILNGIADFIRVIDSSNNVVFVNNSMRTLLSDSEDLMFCNLDNLENSLCNTDITRRCLETGEIIQRDEKLDDKYYSVKCSPILNNVGKIIGVVEIFRNVTLEKKLSLELQERNKQLTKEMNHAKLIQTNLLPEKGFVGNVKIDYLFRPKESLSGDIFDVFQIDKDHIGMYMSDSVGHGFAASMMTMFIRQSTINIPRMLLLDPSKTLMEINSRFIHLNLEPSDYFTIIYGVYNRKNNELTLANAGHNCFPIVFNEDYIKIPEVTGYPISHLSEGYKYENYSMEFYCSDKLLLYTDGVVEAKNKDDEEFGLDRLLDCIEHDDKEVLTTVKDCLEEFVEEEADDDISILIVDVF